MFEGGMGQCDTSSSTACEEKMLFNEKPQAGQTDTYPPHKRNRINKVNGVSVLNNCYPIKKLKEFRN